MHRRDLLRTGASMALAPAIGAAGPAPRSRVRPGEASWPSDAAWEGLGRTVGGRLIRPVPLLAPCESDPRSAQCKAVLTTIANPYYLGDQPAGTQVAGWQDAWTPKASAWAVAAANTGDVAAAVTFARRHNLRLVVKGGGHSYQGTSNAPDSLLVWTRAMRQITLHDGFVAAGDGGAAAPTPAVSIGAGAMWIDAYDAVTTKAGRYVQGGGCATVGVAGLIQSGGFGSFSKRYGAAAASLLEAEVVTADGAVRTVNAHRDPGLFWALKGGGGGSFGVVTRVTLRTHDLAEMAGYANGTIRATSDDAFRRLIARFVDLYAENLFNPHWGESVTIQPDNRLHLGMVSQGLDKTQAEAAWRPFLDWIAAAPGDYSFVAGPRIGVDPARGWWDAAADRGGAAGPWVFDTRPGAPAGHAWWSGDREQVYAFLHGYDSIWLPASLLEKAQRERLAQALFMASRPMAVMLHFNKGLAGAPATAIEATRNTAINPEVLTAFALAIIATGGPAPFPGFPAPDPAFARRNAARVEQSTAVLRAIAPAAGSYVSESNYFNQDWRSAFWGDHYARLRAVKARYDPGGLFFVHHGVGSEDWSADGFTRVG